MDPSILTILMKSFTFTFSSGGARIVPDALLILGVIATIEFALIGLWWIWGHEHNLGSTIAKAVGVIFLAGIIREWGRLTNVLIQGFIEVGLKAGGDVITVTDFTDPGNIAYYGMSVTAVLFERLMSYSGIDAVKNLPELLISGPIGLCIMGAYAALGLWIFVTLIDFYAHAAITTVLLPFAMNGKVAFLAEAAIGVVFASGVRLLVLAFITGATLPILVAQQPGLNPTLRSLWGQLLGAGAVGMLAWRADKSAQGILHRTPQLTIADVTRFVGTSIATIQQLGTAAHSARSAATGAARRLRRTV